MKKTNRFLTILMFIFLYAPMAVLIVASFNTGKDVTNFEGFTLQQYVRLFQDDDLLALLGNSLLVSILASLISVVFGTLSAALCTIGAQSFDINILKKLFGILLLFTGIRELFYRPRKAR